MSTPGPDTYQNKTAASGRTRLGELFRLGVGLALCFGVLEAIESVSVRHMPNVQSMSKTSLDTLWVTPVFHVIVNAVAAALLMLCVRFGVPIKRSLAAGFFALIGALGVTLYSGALARWTAVLLAVGVATQIGRLSSAPAFWTWLRRVTILLGIAVVAAPIGLRSLEAWKTSQSLRRVAPADGAPNVLVLVLDTVRGDYLSSYGFPRPTTPALDRFAAQGTRFAHAYSASSWTLPSHTALLTGLPVSQHGSASAWNRAAATLPTIQKALQAQGYATGAFVANKAFVLPAFGFAEGFDTFNVYDMPTLFARTTFGRFVRLGLRPFGIILDPFKFADTINQRFEQWTATLGDRPFFALVNYMDAHEPYGPRGSRPPLTVFEHGAARTPAENQLLADAYERCVHDLDAKVGQLLERLSRQPWWQKTLVVIVADHGEAIADGTFDHGLDLTWEQIQVPLMLRMPGRIPEGLSVETPVSTNDVAATIQELVGSSAPRLPGRSLSRFFAASPTGDPSADMTGVVTELIDQRTQELTRSIVLGDFQYILNVQTGAERLYRFRDDPAGFRNLAAVAANGPDLARMREALTRHPLPAAVR